MSRELKSLEARRGALKGQLTRFKHFLANPKDINATELEARLEKVYPLLQKFEEVQCEIDCLQDSDPTCVDVEEFEKSYFFLISQARDLLKPHLEPSGSNLPTQAPLSSHEPKVAKLPQISLPEFHGGYEFYQSFKDQFQSLVDKRQDLDDVQKLIYLRSALKGEALDVVTSLETTSRNYIKAWTLLEQRFDNKRLVIGRHLREIFDQEKIDKESSAKIRGLVSNTVKHVQALESLNLPVQHWDAPLVFFLQQKLDPKTLRAWESTCDKDSIPTFERFTKFLLNQAQVLEALEGPNPKAGKFNGNQSSNKLNSSSFAGSTASQASESPSNGQLCPVCNYRHRVWLCRKFLSMSVPERMETVIKANLCSNCLRGGSTHSVEQCPRNHCKKCDTKHNTLLHSSESMSNKRAQTIYSNNAVKPEVSQTSTATDDAASTVLLSTAVVKVLDRFGNPHNCRVLLDSGSQLNFVSEKMSQILGLPSFKRSSPICGIGGFRSSGHRAIRCQVQSQDGTFKADLECIVLPKITLDLPTTPMDISQWRVPSDITLADPNFFRKSTIHMLVGASEFFNIIESAQISLGSGLPTIQNTKLGWVVSGKVALSASPDHVISNNFDYGCSLALEECVRQFWEIEEITPRHALNSEEQACEDLFQQTTTRDESGRFVVHLPIKHNICQLEDNKDNALKRFLSLERKLEKYPSLKEPYVSFMREYARLGHMSIADNVDPPQSYYLPHHCVINEHSSTTKLRVVFDGSCESLSGLSLNDVLMVGPTLQEDLASILMRFRLHRYVMTADVTKMYRQVKVCQDHCSLQRIFWRESPTERLQIFNLNTVTYGTAPASYLATRCLIELARQSQDQYPQGSAAISRDFYVDDYLGGCDSIEEALALQEQVIAITKSGGFELHKWCANNMVLIQGIPPEKRETRYELNPQNQTAIKTLGVWWNPTNDSFSFSILTSNNQFISKRSILSEVARIFDPLGLLGPVILLAKLFLKQLWIEKVDWDTPLESDLKTTWLEFRSQLPHLGSLEIPRRTIQNSSRPVEIHGFSDASEKAYGAAIYLRSQDDLGHYHTQLLCSKSRVSPVNNVSTPRLELCGALILSRLVHKCKESLSISNVSCHLWTDSTVTLAWIAQPSGHWKTFVSNRVSEIHSLTSEFKWHHVPGSQNPSDLLSRGVSPIDIEKSHLWWFGPAWLSMSCENWPSQPLVPDTLSEAKVVGSVVQKEEKIVIDFKRFSNFNRLINTTVYVLRYINQISKGCSPLTASISTAEWEYALQQLIKLTQKEAFGEDVARLQRGKSVSKKGLLTSLNPVLDVNGVIRVGGRLENSNLSYDQKHQIVLPANHCFTLLLIKHFHHKNLHAGPQLLLASIRQQYWPLHGKSLTRKIFHSCLTCFRHQPRSVSQMMGILPTERVQPCRPFINSGVDFCGPLTIKSGTLKQSKSTKAYAALFICLATKAVHVELVSDMTTHAFINALKRFFARRGKSRTMFSDNGTNFAGASRELNQYIEDILKDPQLTNYATSQQVTWKFIPARAPHMGGLWESAIKSLKFHLRRVIGEALLTFEEMSTVLAMIEACLNSRPLFPLSDNPDDLSALTPGHFLIGDALTAIIEPDLKQCKEGSLMRWARLQRMYQHFWDRWSNEYLLTLQARQKWKEGQPNLLINQMVIIKEDNVTPLRWHLGRVVSVHPGSDGLVRVASVKTVDGVFKRHVSKLCPLPTPAKESSDETEDNSLDPK